MRNENNILPRQLFVRDELVHDERKEKNSLSLSLPPLIYYPIVLEDRFVGKREREKEEEEKGKGRRARARKIKRGTFAARFRHRCLLDGGREGMEARGDVAESNQKSVCYSWSSWQQSFIGH